MMKRIGELGLVIDEDTGDFMLTIDGNGVLESSGKLDYEGYALFDDNIGLSGQIAALVDGCK